MIDLRDTEDTIVMILVAAGVGAIAGLGAFALQSKRPVDQDTNISWLGSVLVGALASVGSLFFFSPVAKTVVALPNGTANTRSQYDLVKLVSLAVIVGSGGRAFLTAFQARAGALLSQKASANVAAETPKALTDAKEKIEADVEQAQSAIGPLASQLQELAVAAGAPAPVATAAKALEAAQDELSKVAEQAQIHMQEVQGRIEAAAGETTPQGTPTGGASGQTADASDTTRPGKEQP